MNVGQLRKFLNTLPLDSDDWSVSVIDSDTADLFSVHKASRGTVDSGPTLVLAVQISD